MCIFLFLGDYKRGFATSKFFAYSRHANFFAEQVFYISGVLVFFFKKNVLEQYFRYLTSVFCYWLFLSIIMVSCSMSLSLLRHYFNFLLWRHYPLYYDVTTHSTMTSLLYRYYSLYYDVTSPSTMTSLT